MQATISLIGPKTEPLSTPQPVTRSSPMRAGPWLRILRKLAECVALTRVLYEILTALSLSEFPRLPAKLKESAKQNPAILTLHKVIQKACDPNGSRRFQSARKMCDALLKVQQHSHLAVSTTSNMPVSR